MEERLVKRIVFKGHLPRWFSLLLLLVLCSSVRTDIVDHRGREFIVSFMAQVPYPIYKSGGDNNLYLSTFEDVQVSVQIPFLKQEWDKQYDMHAGEVRVVKLPGNLRTDSFTGKEKKGIRITASKSISVQGLQDLYDKSEGFLGLPVDVLGKDYIVPTYPPVLSSIVQVVAKEDNTQVLFKLRLSEGGRVMYGNKIYYNGDFINVTLNDLEVFQVHGNSDLSGTTVTSSKAIAVFSGNDCAMVPIDVLPCNHLVEQIPPVSVWGRDFITSPTPNRPSGKDEVHVLASKDNTKVNVDWQFKKTLSKGETYQIQAPSKESLEISTSNPSLVVQYTGGADSPSMSIVPTRQWASNDYTVYVANGVDGYMNVVIDTRLRSGLRVRGPLDIMLMNWKTLAGGLSQVSLHFSKSGIYHVYHDSPLVNFTSVMYGMTSKKLFSFPAGFKWELPMEQNCSMTQPQGGDEIDNDCDGVSDEELANDKDDDGDGLIDEDLIKPPEFIELLRKVDGGWNDWNEWSLCTKAFGGIQTRSRECVNPKPRNGGKPCSGARVVIRECGNMSSCHEVFPVRFTTGDIPSRGTMEIYKNNTWEKLCSANWDDAEVDLTCRAVGYFNDSPDVNGTWQEGTNGSNATVYRSCTPVIHTCDNNTKDDPQSCKVPVRLNGANITYGGRVEVFYRGKWGTICRNDWDLNDVKVVCNQLGFQGALAEFVGSKVTEENIPFLMSKVSCDGRESNLASCQRTDGEHDCPDGKGAQALCEPKNRRVLEKRTFVSDIGSSETFHCSLQNETSMIKWYVKGTVASPTGRRVKASGGKLTVSNVRLSDGGTYECGGLKYTRFYIIYVNAIFTNVLPSQTLVSGESGIIRCSAVGTPTPLFDEWKKDGHKTLDKNRFRHLPNGNLRVYQVRPEDKGNYTCTLKQSKGKERITSKRQIIHVSVVVPPNIEVSSSRNFPREGDNVSLTCNITEGSPAPEIHWFKDGTSKEDKKGAVFDLANVTANDKGWYTCEAVNKGGSSDASILITVDTPPKINPVLKNQSVPLNSTFTIKCFAGGDPQPKVNWTKTGTHLSITNNTLTINHMTVNDTGKYGCSAENRAGNISATIWIDVMEKPRAEIILDLHPTMEEGDELKLTCNVSEATSEVKWQKDGVSVSSRANISQIGDKSILVIKNIKTSDSGDYSCEAHNQAGFMSSTTVEINVKAKKPTAEMIPDSYPIMLEGGELKLTCKVSKTTSLVKWMKNGNTVTSNSRVHISQIVDDNSILVIKNVRSGDSGDYSCEAHNQADLTFMSSTVEIKVRAVPSSGINVEWYYIGGPVLAVIFIILAVVTWYIRKRRKAAKANVTSRHDEEQGGQEMDELEVNREVDQWEISTGCIALQKVIGTGSFGAVWRATLSQPDAGRPGKQIVAAKCFTPTSGKDGRKALMREIELGKLLGVKPQGNVVTFIGCVTTQIHPILIMEYMAYGDLLGYLRKSRGIQDKYHLGEDAAAFQLQTYDLVLFAKQIAAGMVYLGSYGVIHRDLAARNVLLDRNFVCKVTDFGLAYQNFKYGHGQAKKGCMPIKWTAPEILLGNPASLCYQSDVWSYGIVLYEIFTIGGIPYPEWSEAKTIAEIDKGYRMPKPEHIDDTLYDLMLRCWHRNPDFRPPFEFLRKKMLSYIEEKTYLELLNMSEYDAAKYSKVEDIPVEGKRERTSRKKSRSLRHKPVPPPRKKKWSSVQY